MKTSFFVLCIMVSGCATRHAPHPATSVQRYKIDLGYLDEPRVQEQVAAREKYRRKTSELARSFFKTIERAQALNFAASKISQALDAESARRCQSEGILFQAWITRLPETLRYVSDHADVFNARVERGGYMLVDPGMDRDLETVVHAADLAEKETATAEVRMRGFCSCLGVSFTIRNPSGNIVFQTSVPAQI